MTPGATTGTGRSPGPTPKQLGQAAFLCFLDAEPDERIARRLGVCRRTLARWKHRAEFVAALAALVCYYERERRRTIRGRYRG